MSIVKLQPDESVQFTVTAVGEADGTYGKQLKFIGRTPTDADAAFHMSFESADRQLGHLKLDRQTVVGRTVLFSAKKVGAKKFIDINMATSETGAPVAPRAPEPAAPTPVAPAQSAESKAEEAEAAKERARRLWTRECKIYDQCVEHILAEIVPKLQQAKITITQEGVSAMAASLYIGCQKRGL